MYEIDIKVDCKRMDDSSWGSTTTHVVRKLDYAQLVQMQRELVTALGGLLLDYGESKLKVEPVPDEAVKTNAYAR